MEERDFSVTHVRRSGNSASHSMANFGRANGRTMVWLGSGPEEVLNVALRDCTP